MPSQWEFPGVYIEEVPSSVRSIMGVATSITAFLGRAARGMTDVPVTVNRFGDFELAFGGLNTTYPMSYAVRDFFINGGSHALVVRLYKASKGDAPLSAASDLTIDTLTLTATSPGAWGKKLRGTVDVDVPDEMRQQLSLGPNDVLFNLTLHLGTTTERYLNLTLSDNARRIDRVLEAGSHLATWKGDWKAPTADNLTASVAKLKHQRDERKKLDHAIANGVTAEIDAAQKTFATAAAACQAALEALSDPASQAEQKLAGALSAKPPVQADVDAARKAVADAEAEMGGSDGLALDEATYEGDQNQKRGLFALDKADLFNLLCIAPDTRGGDVPVAVYQAALAYCAERRAVLIVDSPAAWSANKKTAAAAAQEGLSDLGLSGPAARNAALYFPRLLESDPLRDGLIDKFVPCGAVAGVMARTDSARGVWKAPAGLDAAVNGIQGFDVSLNDAEKDMLNQMGINCLRDFPGNGRVVWGARTLRGADQLADEYKYVPVRRTALYIEESLDRGTQWVVFEPNGEPLWAQIRLNVGEFMHNLFRQGAFQGQTPRDAYFVKCESGTTTQDDINRGIVNIIVGFAPLKPAEFVVLQLQQVAGQT